MKQRKLLLGVLTVVTAIALGACQGDKNTDTSEAGNHSSETPTAGESVNDTQQTPADTDDLNNQDYQDNPVYGGSIVIGMTQDLVSLDPHQITDAGTRNVVFNLYEGLVKPTSDGDLVPAVASDYSISEDAMTYRFILREGVAFHDGSTVTAEDVKYSIERYAEIQGESSAFSILDEVVIEDEQTIVVKLKDGNSEFLPSLTFGIIPASNDDPEGNPIGTGPFKFVSYTPGQNLKLQKHTAYWNSPYPYLDNAEFKFVADVDTAFLELQAGTVDVLSYLTAAQVEVLGDSYDIVEGSMNLVQAMFLNNAYEPLTDVRVRQALCYAVDRQVMNDFLFGGKSHLLGTHMISSIVKYYEPTTENLYEHNVEKAIQLLEEAGYGDGFDLEITVPSSYSQHVDTAQILVEQLAEVGVRATIRQVEWNTWLSDVYRERNYQATVVGFDGTLAPGDWMKRYKSDASNNMMNYTNEEYDTIFEQAKAVVDDTEKAKLYKQLQMILAEDAAAVYIQEPADFVAVNNKYGGYQFYPVAAQDLSTIYQRGE